MRLRKGIEEGERRAPAAASNLENASPWTDGSLDGQGSELVVARPHDESRFQRLAGSCPMNPGRCPGLV